MCGHSWTTSYAVIAEPLTLSEAQALIYQGGVVSSLQTQSRILLPIFLVVSSL
jgi:hypothetical protein